MTRILAFDTETSGLCDFRSPPFAHGQPYCLEIGWIYSASGRLEDARPGCLLVNWGADITIEARAQEVHGLSKEYLAEYGISPRAVLNIFGLLVMQSDMILGHNVEFDLLIMRCMAAKLDRLEAIDAALARKEHYCTKKASTGICKIPHPMRPREYKWPTLQEVYRHFFGREFAQAHSAMADITATWEVYHEIKAFEARGLENPLPPDSDNPYTGGAKAAEAGV